MTSFTTDKSAVSSKKNIILKRASILLLISNTYLDFNVSVCGVRGTKGPKQRPSVDPELAPSPQSPGRKLENGRRNSTQRRKAKKKRKTSQNQKGLVKREAFPAKSKHREKTKEGRKKRRRKKGRKKAMIKGKLRQGEGGAALQGQDVRTRQVWPWMVR